LVEVESDVVITMTVILPGQSKKCAHVVGIDLDSLFIEGGDLLGRCAQSC
jgi:hypothetical protein